MLPAQCCWWSARRRDGSGRCGRRYLHCELAEILAAEQHAKTFRRAAEIFEHMHALMQAARLVLCRQPVMRLGVAVCVVEHDKSLEARALADELTKIAH